MEKEATVDFASQFSNSAKEVISYSREEALRLGNDFIGTEHFVLGILKQNDNIGAEILNYSIEKIDRLKSEIEGSIEGVMAQNIEMVNLPLTKQAEKVIRGSVLQAKNHNTTIIDSGCILLSILLSSQPSKSQF